MSSFWPSGRDAVAALGPLLWKQLTLLGFNAPEYARKEGLRDPDALGPRMFHSQSPNRGGLAAVLHFLFSKYSEEYAKQIAPCFPTYDTEGKREFRTVAMAIIQAMCDARLLPKEAAIRSGSILNVPEGVRAYQLCVQIATVVTLRVMAREFPSHFRPQASVTDETGCGVPSTANKPECVAVCRALQARILHTSSVFQRRAACMMDAQRVWMATADELAGRYTRSTAHATAVSSAPSVPLAARSEEEIELLKAPVDGGWRAVEAYLNHDDTKRTMDAMADFVDRKQHPLSHRVDVGPLKVALSSSAPSGSLLSQSLQRFQASVSQVLTQCGETGAFAGLLGSQTHVHASVQSVNQSLGNMRAINAKLRESIAATRSSVARLKGAAPVLATPAKPSARLVEATPAHTYLPQHYDSGAVLAAQPTPPRFATPTRLSARK